MNKKNKQGIYCIEHIDTGKKYYGSSSNITKRFYTHKRMLMKNNHHNVYLQRAFNKHGLSAFSFYIVEETFDYNNEQLFLLEKQYLITNVNGYNIGSVGGGDNLTNHPYKDEIIRKRTETYKNNYKLLPEEEKKRRSDDRKGEKNGNYRNGGISYKYCPMCNIRKIQSTYKTCGTCRDRTGNNNPFYGKKHSEETIAKLRINNRQNSWAQGLKPEDIPYTKQYEIMYSDGTKKIVYGLKTIAEEFKSSIANVAYTIERMNRKSYPTKRSRFYGVTIKEVI